MQYSQDQNVDQYDEDSFAAGRELGFKQGCEYATSKMLGTLNLLAVNVNAVRDVSVESVTVRNNNAKELRKPYSRSLPRTRYTSQENREIAEAAILIRKQNPEVRGQSFAKQIKDRLGSTRSIRSIEQHILRNLKGAIESGQDKV